MIRTALCLLAAIACMLSLSLPATQAADPAPLKVLYITGGGYHDYKKLATVLTEGMAKHAKLEFTVKWDLETLRDPKLGEGYDCIIYNLCFSESKDETLINNAIRVTKEGKPTLLVHCAMHCFQASDAWTDCCGLRTRRHDAYRAFTTKRSEPLHPIAAKWPADWSTKGDELYQNIAFPKDSTPVLTAYSPESKKDHVVAWAHTHGKGKVFATTLGHDQNTAGQDSYHELLARGVLWTCGKLAK